MTVATVLACSVAEVGVFYSVRCAASPSSFEPMAVGGWCSGA